MIYFKMVWIVIGVVVLSFLLGSIIVSIELPVEKWFVPVSVLIVSFVFVFVLPMDLFETNEQ